MTKTNRPNVVPTKSDEAREARAWIAQRLSFEALLADLERSTPVR